MSAKIGDTVRVLYTGKLKDKTVFDSSDGEPLEFVIGDGMVIPGFEEAVIGMEVGQHKTIEVSSNKAYGPHLDGLVATVSRSQFPDSVVPEKGKQIRVANQLGQTFVMTIIDVTDGSVTLDANHPLAGKDLVFEIDLVQIN
ncbi:MAG: peptidylprolyl isomerase [Fibrobacter sp.]|nr:peptidylprolyl isomerase [Fibrobacter sp.]